MLVVLPPEHETLQERFAGQTTPPSPLPPEPDDPPMMKVPPLLLPPLPLPPSLLCDPPHEATLAMAESKANAIGPRLGKRMTTSLAGTTEKQDPKVQYPARRP